MLNQIILVGRIATIKTIQKEKTTLTMAVPRNFKNSAGEYETDFIKISLKDNLATNAMEYCKVGDLIGIKGRIESINNRIVIIAEKVTFLSSKGVSENASNN